MKTNYIDHIGIAVKNQDEIYHIMKVYLIRNVMQCSILRINL